MQGGREMSTKGGRAIRQIFDHTINQRNQVEWAKWVPNGDRIIYSSTEGNPAEREFFDLSTTNGQKKNLAWSQSGMRTNPQMNDSGEPMLLYSFSQWNRPDDLQVQRACGNCEGINFPKTLTETVPMEFTRRAWSVPKFFDIPSRDGKAIKSKIYLPPGHNAKQKYPMVIFVHKRATYRTRSTAGTTTIAVYVRRSADAEGLCCSRHRYRGSAGYGRDGVPTFTVFSAVRLGDHIDAIDYMVKNYSVDQNVSTMAGATVALWPECWYFVHPDRIAAAAAYVRYSVENYYAANPSYTAQQQLRTKSKLTNAVRRSHTRRNSRSPY
jgi:hypothetical protein